MKKQTEVNFHTLECHQGSLRNRDETRQKIYISNAGICLFATVGGKSFLELLRKSANLHFQGADCMNWAGPVNQSDRFHQNLKPSPNECSIIQLCWMVLDCVAKRMQYVVRCRLELWKLEIWEE